LNDGSSWGSEFSLDEHNRGAGPLFPSLALARPGWGAAVMMSARPVPMLNMFVFRFIFMIKDSFISMVFGLAGFGQPDPSFTATLS
jgi:hypothetical protein